MTERVVQPAATPDPKQLRALGKLVFRAAQLEHYAASCLYSLVGEPDVAVAVIVGQGLQRILELTATLIGTRVPDMSDEFAQVRAQARAAYDERNRHVHWYWSPDATRRMRFNRKTLEVEEFESTFDGIAEATARLTAATERLREFGVRAVAEYRERHKDLDSTP